MKSDTWIDHMFDNWEVGNRNGNNRGTRSRDA